MMTPRPGRTVETYVAYGMTEQLFQACCSQGEYVIPQKQKGTPVPKTEAGEDLGVGKGWWYEGSFPRLASVSFPTASGNS